MSLFPTGQVVITKGALEALDDVDIYSALERHCKGDWGNVCGEDWQENDLSLKAGFRIQSSYTSANHVKFWIITEADRSATTVLLPGEY